MNASGRKYSLAIKNIEFSGGPDRTNNEYVFGLSLALDALLGSFRAIESQSKSFSAQKCIFLQFLGVSLPTTGNEEKLWKFNYFQKKQKKSP